MITSCEDETRSESLTQKNEIGYKVVSRMPDGRLVSAMSPLLVEYKKDEEISAEVGRIFVFSNLHYARHFAGTNSTWNGKPEAWEVHVRDVRPEPICLTMGWHPSREAVQDFWNGNGKFATTLTPRGTLSCATLTLRNLIVVY